MVGLGDSVISYKETDERQYEDEEYFDEEYREGDEAFLAACAVCLRIIFTPIPLTPAVSASRSG